MRKISFLFPLTLLLIIGGSLTVLADTPHDLSIQEQKRLDALNVPAITPQQQALIDQEMAIKAQAMANYVPVDQPLDPYFIETAKKLNVDITGLSDDEIMIKVKEAEMQVAIDHPFILTPEQQTELDHQIAEKNALIGK